MKNDDFSAEDLPRLFEEERIFIDVRAPIEFAQGALPGATNKPLLNDQERSAIGTTYKREGQEAAVQLGHQLITGSVKEHRIQNWIDLLKKNPDAVFYCFRGGMRSQISRMWTAENGITRPLLIGGYKAARTYLLANLEIPTPYLVVAGATGSGKTDLLKSVSSIHQILDLEARAVHRGSAFGALGEQPSQASFENQLSADLILARKRLQRTQSVLVEDESRMIGKLSLPLPIIATIRSSPVLLIEEPLAARVERIFQGYILATALGKNHEAPEALELFENFKQSVLAISKKLGGLKSQEILASIDDAKSSFAARGDLSKNKIWIEKILVHYYDPMYEAGLKKRELCVEFRGSWQEARDYLKLADHSVVRRS